MAAQTNILDELCLDWFVWEQPNTAWLWPENSLPAPPTEAQWGSVVLRGPCTLEVPIARYAGAHRSIPFLGESWMLPCLLPNPLLSSDIPLAH